MDILELLKTQLNGPVMERLGSAVGLDAAQAQSIGQAILPAQVAAIQQQTSTEAGAQHLLDLAAQVPTEGTQEALDTPAGLEQVRQSGTALLPQLLGDRLDGAVGQIASQTGAGQGHVLGMMQMVLPLVLGLVGQQAGKLGLNASSLGTLFSGGLGGAAGLGGMAAGLGAAAVGLGGAAVAGLGSAAGKLGDGVSGLGDGLSKGVGNAAGGLSDAASGIGGAAVGLGGAAAAGLGTAADNLGAGVTGLGANLSKGAGAAAAGIGAAAAGLGSTASSAVTDGMATVGQGAGLGGGVLHTNPALGGRRGLGWLWLLPLLLLLLLGGCFLLRGKPATPFTLTDPAGGAAVTGAFAIKGTGKAGHEVTVTENGQAVGKTTVGEDGTFSADVPAPSAGEHTYAVSEDGSSEALPLTVKAADSMAGMDMSGKFAVASPTDGASLPAGAFELKGSGKPGEVLEIFEDGVSLGKVTVGADGTWSLNVPSPAAGAHTYTVKGPDGAELGSVKATVAASTASAANCTKDFSLSIPDGQTVAQPFRFGGVGSGKSYTVTVMRGARKIGSKLLPLDGTCGYSYTSKPGKGTITYSVSQTGSAEVAGKITLTVK